MISRLLFTEAGASIFYNLHYLRDDHVVYLQHSYPNLPLRVYTFCI